MRGLLSQQMSAVQTPGDAIKAELEKRGWTQSDLAAVLGKHQPAVNELIQSKRSVTPEMAVALASAFNNQPAYWLRLDSDYRISLLSPNQEIQERARLFCFAPVGDMQKRGWIREHTSLEGLKRELFRFFQISSLEESPRFHANARKPLDTADLTPAQIAWCIRGGQLAARLRTKPFSSSAFRQSLPELRKLADYPEKITQIPRFLAEIGIRLAVVEPLPHSPIDGAAFWLADDVPVVLLSARYDRIDCLWFTLLHELSHIANKDAQSVDSDLVGESSARDLGEIERRANERAANFLVPSDKLESCIIRVNPFYSKERIIQFAHRMKVHPGIVAGQLQFRREIGWHANREMLVKVRARIVQTAMTDGWGVPTPAL
jgi:HTH-type transcriptional regulator/antitoxin HigA